MSPRSAIAGKWLSPATGKRETLDGDVAAVSSSLSPFIATPGAFGKYPHGKTRG
jgi:hypothetical protein